MKKVLWMAVGLGLLVVLNVLGDVTVETEMTRTNNYWGEFPDVEGYDGLGFSREEAEARYALGKEYLLNHTLLYENGMKEYIREQYKQNYPNEMGLCLMARIENETITIYNHSEAWIRYQDENSVGFDCENSPEINVVMHSHPDIQRVWNLCYPSENDINSLYDYEMVACGVGEDITEVLAYRTEREEYGGIPVVIETYEPGVVVYWDGGSTLSASEIERNYQVWLYIGMGEDEVIYFGVE